VADDTQAFLDAIDAIGRAGTIFVPEGRYRITKQLNIPSRVVLRGMLGHPCLPAHSNLAVNNLTSF